MMAPMNIPTIPLKFRALWSAEARFELEYTEMLERGKTIIRAEEAIAVFEARLEQYDGPLRDRIEGKLDAMKTVVRRARAALNIMVVDFNCRKSLYNQTNMALNAGFDHRALQRQFDFAMRELTQVQ